MTSRDDVHENSFAATNDKIDFESFAFETEDDEAWQEFREPDADCTARGVKMMQWLATRPESEIAVVTHSSYLRHLFGAFGQNIAKKDKEALHRTVCLVPVFPFHCCFFCCSLSFLDVLLARSLARSLSLSLPGAASTQPFPFCVCPRTLLAPLTVPQAGNAEIRSVTLAMHKGFYPDGEWDGDTYIPSHPSFRKGRYAPTAEAVQALHNGLASD
jgi:hypothetical protein